MEATGSLLLMARTGRIELVSESLARGLTRAFELVEAGDLQAAVELAARLDRSCPGHADVQHLLGVIAAKQEDDPQALRLIRRAIKLNGTSADFHNSLGAVYKHQGDLQRALECYRRAVQLDPGHAVAHDNLGSTLADLTEYREARECFARAVALRPGFAEAHCNLANLWFREGRLEEAEAEAREAIGLKPDFHRAYFLLAHLKHYPSLESPETRQLMDWMQGLLGSPGLSERHASTLNFALAKVFNDGGEYPRAFEFYRRGNQLRRGLLGDPDRCLDQMESFTQRLMEVFDRDLFQALEGGGIDSEIPVFIVGVPRSGTTLVEQILSSHPQVAGAGEQGFLRTLESELARRPGNAYPEGVAGWARDAAKEKALAYLELLRRYGPGSRRVSDKMPDNFLRLGLIALMFPRARVVHCRRHPMDSGASIFFQSFKEDLCFAFGLGDIGRYHCLYHRLMDHWRKVLPIPMLELQYEDLVSDPEPQTRRLIEFLGLEWNDLCLDHTANPRTVVTASSWQVRQPLYTSSVGRWRRYGEGFEPLRQALLACGALGREGPA